MAYCDIMRSAWEKNITPNYESVLNFLICEITDNKVKGEYPYSTNTLI